MLRAPKAFILAFLLIGCGYKPHIKVSGEQVNSSKSNEFCQEISNQTQTSSARALLNADFRQGKSSQAARYAVLFKAPDSVRVEVLPTQSFYALAVLAGDSVSGFTLLDSSAHQALIAKNFAALSETIFQGVSLNLDDLVSLLTGVVPANVCDLNTSISVNETNNELYVRSNAARRIWVLDLSTKRLKSFAVIDPFSDNHELEFVIDALETNGKLHFYAPLLDIDGSFVLSKYELDAPIADKLFDVPIPGDYKVIEIN